MCRLYAGGITIALWHHLRMVYIILPAFSAFAAWHLLRSHMNFDISFSSSMKNTIESLMKIALN